MSRVMRRLMRAPTIRAKLVRIGLITTGISTMLIGLLLLAGVFYLERERMKDELLIQAAIASENSTAALSFSDARGAGEVLMALHAAKSIKVAAIYDLRGQLFASYARTTGAVVPAAPPAPDHRYRMGLTEFDVSAPIRFNGKHIGTTYLCASFNDFYVYLIRYALLGLLAAIIALGSAILLLLRLQRSVTAPLQALGRLVEQVSSRRDYTVRALVRGRDEVAVLAAGINTMLDRIRQRDQDLELEIGERKLVEEHILRLNETLEQRVRERSLQLEVERNFVATVLDTTSALMFVLDRDGAIINANLAAKSASRRAPDLLLGRTMWTLFADPADGARAHTACVAAFDGRSGAEVEGEWVGRDGRVRKIAWRFTVLPDSGSATRSVIATGTDVTEQKLIEQNLEQARRAAEQGSRAKSEFLANMSHEMRTPLSGVIGMLDIALRDAALQKATRKQVELGLTNAQSLLGIINDLLDFSKIEAGKLSIEDLPFSLRELVESVSALFTRRASESNVGFELEIDTALPAYVRGDPMRLRQVLVNLLGNAFKFTASGKLAVRVVLVGRSDGCSKIAFSVQDSGIGISAADQKRLFQKFEQADSSTTRRYGGTGLGLAICRQLVELMGGTIGVDSTLGVGSTFRFFLDLADGCAPHAEVIAPLAAHSHQLHVLCAEDFPTNQIIIRTQLEEMGHRVEMVDDGAQAVAACARTQFDLVLMDGRMPVMDGIAATKMIRAGGSADAPVRNREIVIVALTANASGEDRTRYLTAGMDDFMSKPLERSQLHALLARVIAQRLQQGASLRVSQAAQGGQHADLDAMFGVAALAPNMAPDSAPEMAQGVAPVGRALSAPPGFQARIRHAFAQDVPGRLAELDAAIVAGDKECAARVLHGFKGSAAYLDADELMRLCAELERLADAGQLSVVTAALPRVRALVQSVAEDC